MNRPALLSLALLLALGCDSTPMTDAGPADAGDGTPDAGPPPPDVSGLPTVAADNALGPEDPRFEGQQRFLWDTFGTEIVSGYPPADFFLSLMTDEPEVFGDQYAGFGFVPDPGDDFPVGFKRGLEDPTQMQNTCALCHVGELPDGRLWIGAPNTHLEFSRFLVEANDRWVARGNEPFLDDVERAKRLALGPGRTSAESSEVAMAVPADFPVYFDLADRTALNYLGTGGDVRTEVYLALYAFGVGNPNPREAVIRWQGEARVGPLVDFMGHIAAPSAPAQDPAMVEAGRAIYERERCDGCHHVDDSSALGIVTYDDAPDGLERYPGDDPDFPRGSIRTSAAHRSLIDTDEGVGDIFRFITTHGLTTTLSDGYRASDLHALWATAPYLHNGSVPTLDDLLRPPAERPATFDRDGFTVGTTTEGNGNEGHEFGTGITAEERAALVAYLLSL